MNNWFLIPYMVLRLSMMDQPALMVHDPAWPLYTVGPEYVTEVDITFGVDLFSFLTLEGQLVNKQVPPWAEENSGNWFSPFQDQYYVRAFAHWKGLSLGIEHQCDHPVYPWLEEDVPRWDYAYNYKIFLEIDSRGFR